MPAFVAKRYEQILTQMIARVVSRSKLSDISDSAVSKHVLAAAARQDDEQYFQMTLLLQLFSIDTATGDDLDERAADIQPGVITRNTAVKARGNLQFSRPGTAGTITIPAGTKAKTVGGKIFTTTAIGSIANLASTSGLIPAIADESGADSNAASATIIKLVTKPTGVTGVTNPAAFRYGLDKEGDDSFRNRLKLFLNALAKSTVDALEYYVLGAQDSTGATILFSRAIEDLANRGYVTLYIDDGTGSAESSAVEAGTDLIAVYTWDGTTIVKTPDPGPGVSLEVAVGDWIGIKSDGEFFRVASIDEVPDPNEITITPIGIFTIPVGVTTTVKNPEMLTEGLSGPIPDTAVGGETRLYLDNVPVKDSATFVLISSHRGVLVLNTDYTLNSAAGQVVFSPALVAGEAVFAWPYTYYTGLIQLAQKIIDGDANDRENYPGVRAGGVLVWVRTPTVLTQTIDVTVTIMEGYDHATTRTAVKEAIKNYINTLGISGDVVRSKLIKVIMGVAGIYNVTVTTPATDIILLDDEMARTTDPNITVN